MKEEKESETNGSFAVDFDAPKNYKVILLNDDYTTMEFVVNLLIDVFGRKLDEAFEIMQKVHQEGSGVAGIYAFDIAQSRARRAMQKARGRGYPLKCHVEPVLDERF